MATRIPPLPADVLRRVTRTANFHGTMVIVVAGLSTVIGALSLDAVLIVCGALATYAGVLERGGAQRLRAGDATGAAALPRSQWLMLGAIWGYCLGRLALYDPALVEAAFTPELRRQFSDAGFDAKGIIELTHRIFFLTYTILPLVALLYPGGLGWYYFCKRAVLRQGAAEVLAVTAEPGTKQASALGK